jgi:hypothetical protein
VILLSFVFQHPSWEGWFTPLRRNTYISNDKKRTTSLELDLHVDEVMERAKESMAQDVIAIRMQSQNLIDKQHRLLAEAQARCEAHIALAHNRMMHASKTYEKSFAEAIQRQLENVLESTITGDTLNREMGIAAQAHRDSIHKMTAIPPLAMDENRLQLQIRCATAEQKSGRSSGGTPGSQGERF